MSNVDCSLNIIKTTNKVAIFALHIFEGMFGYIELAFEPHLISDFTNFVTANLQINVL